MDRGTQVTRAARPTRRAEGRAETQLRNVSSRESWRRPPHPHLGEPVIRAHRPSHEGRLPLAWSPQPAWPLDEAVGRSYAGHFPGAQPAEGRSRSLHRATLRGQPSPPNRGRSMRGGKHDPCAHPLMNQLSSSGERREQAGLALNTWFPRLHREDR